MWFSTGVTKRPATLGRKRDHTLDAQILQAAINIFAEVGFDSMRWLVRLLFQ